MQDTQKQESYLVSTVTDDDDDNTDTATGTTSTIAVTEETAQQDKLRIAAEKRRQKILQQANTRMSIVEGTYSATASSTTTIEGIAAPDVGVDTPVEDSINKVVDGIETPLELSTTTDTSLVTTESSTTASTSTKSSKLAAMRRLRFQKKTTATTPVLSASAPSVQIDKNAATVDETPVNVNETAIADTAEVIESMKEGVTEVIEGMFTSQTLVHENTTEANVDDKTPIATATTTTTNATKKYLGVAKMRRRMNKERQDVGGISIDANDKSADQSVTPNESISTNKTTTIHLPKKQRSMIATLPILMYALTTVVLFLTGLHIGVQQSQINYCYTNAVVANNDTHNGYCYNTANTQQWSLMVHSELAPRKMGGLQRLLSTTMHMVGVPINDASVVSSKVNDNIVSQIPELDHDATTGRLLSVVHNDDDTEDEFASTTESTKRLLGKGTNIDPLFQVDLDALTAGDGLYFSMGRFAVRIHRTILTVVYYTPQSIVQSIVSFIWSFVQTPPVLFMMALFIRHGMGRVILGAKLPSSVVDETQHKDILSTVKTFVMKFLLSSFPTITVFYDVWTYIRSDMYVILCGLFVGLALSHHHQADSPYGEVTPATKILTTTTLTGVSDEL